MRVNEPGQIDAKGVVAAYVPEFLERMLLAPEDISNPDALQSAVDSLDGEVRDLADALIIGVGGGQVLPERYHARVDEIGESLWLSGVLLPKVNPSRGSTIDPRYYTASSRLNPALAQVSPLVEVQGSAEGEASASPSSTQWDARIIAVKLETEPMRVTQSGALRKDEVERLVLRLGGDTLRWKLAMALARETSLARVVGKLLHGFPGVRTRRVRDPIELLEGVDSLAAEALLRVAGGQWISLEALADALSQRCPEVLDGAPRSQVRLSLGSAACALQRFGRLDAIRGTEGVRAVRATCQTEAVPRGIMMTSDCEILVVPGALNGKEFGRLCRMAPYQGGDVIYRHRLSREGIAADLAAGYTDAVDWLKSLSAAGLPGSVKELVQGWERSVQRMTLWTGVTLVEEDGILRRVSSTPDVGNRFDYTAPCTGEVESTGNRLEVRKDGCPLGLKAALDRILPRDEGRDSHWIWVLDACSIQDPEERLVELRSRISGEIPARLEAVVYSAAGRNHLELESAVVLHLAPEILTALRRDPELGDKLSRVVRDDQVLVAEDDLEEVRAVLALLGLR